MNDGWYWFTCGRGEGIRSIAQLVNGQWFCVNEVGPVPLAELNRRGWDLGPRVKWRKPKNK